MEKETEFSVPAEELCCLIGNLFGGLRPPCEGTRPEALTICGATHSGRSGKLVILGDRCLFYGHPEDLEAVRNGKCLERTCRKPHA